MQWKVIKRQKLICKGKLFWLNTITLYYTDVEKMQ